MFVKKDLRKIPVIFADATSSIRTEDGIAYDNKDGDDAKPLTELRLGRRPAEFKGSISALCQPSYVPALQNLISLSLYECQISNLDGVGFFATGTRNYEGGYDSENADSQIDSFLSKENICCPNLTELNLGRNPIRSLPSELGLLSNSLTSLWLDDCELDGPLPECLYALEKLETLRVSNNKITALKGGQGGVEKWKFMKVLCLDGNRLESLPSEFVCMTKLNSLMLRKNMLTSLPDGVPGKTHPDLLLLHVSSNQLNSLPPSITQCTSLKKIYANGNHIKSIPENFSKLHSLEHCNFSNNEIDSLSATFLERFGEPDCKAATCKKDPRCMIYLDQNPVMKKEKRKHDNEDIDSPSIQSMDVD